MRRTLSLFFLMGLPLIGACLPLPATLTPEPLTASATPPPTQTIVWFPPSATPSAIAIPTYTATPEMSPGIGSLLFKDTFTEAALWDTVTSAQASVLVQDERLTLAVEPGVTVTTLRRDVTLGDFYAEITARIGLCRGADTYGLIIRSNGAALYRLSLSCNGLIAVERVKDSIRQSLLEPSPSGDVPLGPPGEVTIGLWAVGSELRLFLNGRYQMAIRDRASASGALGVFVRSNGDTPVTITFSDLTVYDVDYVAPTPTPMP